MSMIEIAVFPLDNQGISRIDDFGDYCLNLSLLWGVKCQITANGARIEGDTDSLFEILHELDNSSLIMGAKKRAVVTLKLDGIEDRAHKAGDNKGRSL